MEKPPMLNDMNKDLWNCNILLLHNTLIVRRCSRDGTTEGNCVRQKRREQLSGTRCTRLKSLALCSGDLAIQMALDNLTDKILVSNAKNEYRFSEEWVFLIQFEIIASFIKTIKYSQSIHFYSLILRYEQRLLVKNFVLQEYSHL